MGAESQAGRRQVKLAAASGLDKPGASRQRHDQAERADAAFRNAAIPEETPS
jgi:hypothetical protein